MIKATKTKKDPYDTDSSLSSFEDDEKDYESCVDFPEFDKQIKEALERFGGKVFIKLNWSSPQDAYWCLNRLSCETLKDIYMLLSSSDFISHDLNEPFDHCNENTDEEKDTQKKNIKFYLVIKEWRGTINRSMEFRCFVKDHKLVGWFQICFSFGHIFFK